MTFGERLTQLRKENGYGKRNAFAEVLGIPETTLRNYETDAREPGHKFLARISNMFDVSVDYLLCLTDEKEKTNSYQLKSSEYRIIEKYKDLDEYGKETVRILLDRESGRMKEMQKKNSAEEFSSEIAPDKDYLIANAAHDKEGATEEEKEVDDACMDDENIWKN